MNNMFGFDELQKLLDCSDDAKLEVTMYGFKHRLWFRLFPKHNEWPLIETDDVYQVIDMLKNHLTQLKEGKK